MGYLINASSIGFVTFTISNVDLLLWDNTNPLILSDTKNFIVNQCSILYTDATIPLTFTGIPEINLTDSVNVIEYAFNISGYTLNNNESIRLSGGNKSSNNVDTYNLLNGLQLDCSTAVNGGDGQLIVYLWGTYV